jgi:hypothetical protein
MRSLFLFKSIIIASFLFLTTCTSDKVGDFNLKTKYVFVIIVDGPRYSETWGDASHFYVPRMSEYMASQGVVNTQFFNDGQTYTVPGHTAIASGNYQDMNNSGLDLPSHPTIFQLWLKATGNSANLAWLVTSKDKLQVLANSSDPSWKNKYMASTNCGVNGAGLGSGYREDSLTNIALMNVISANHPHLLLVNFREPDFSGHQSNWLNYLKGIKDTDEYVYQIWNLIQTDPFYKDKTSLFVTNDHGRHLDTISGGYPSHGDGCEGCRHINFYAFGPDFKKNKIISTPRELIDISATIAAMMKFDNTSMQGKVMTELFID